MKLGKIFQIKNKKRRVKKENVEQEFTDFARKIARLESLKHELNSLDTKGFEPEAKIIRSKLKDTKAIPEIE